MSTLPLTSLSVHRDPQRQSLSEARQLIADWGKNWQETKEGMMTDE
ncbi:MAG: hypothetical protein JWN24_2027 [Phycisphaerales bacterium]|nr:hypothetical protein [Phycisphaerales bacterium]